MSALPDARAQPRRLPDAEAVAASALGGEYADIVCLDLFGEPVRPGFGQRGRPRHMPTPATRARVIELRSEGLSHLSIAAALGITHPTLVLNYPAELGSASQAWRRRADRDQNGVTTMREAQAPAWLAQAHEMMAASTTPMRGGAGRLTRMRAALEVLNPMDRKLLLEALDEISRPMTAREIDEALIPTGLSRSERKPLVASLKRFPIMLIARP